MSLEYTLVTFCFIIKCFEIFTENNGDENQVQFLFCFTNLYWYIRTNVQNLQLLHTLTRITENVGCEIIINWSIKFDYIW